MKKYTYLIITLLAILSLHACGESTRTPERTRVEELNKIQGGRGIDYDYKGPNANPTQSLTPIE